MQELDAEDSSLIEEHDSHAAPALLVRDASPWRLPFIRGLRAIAAESRAHLPVPVLAVNAVTQIASASLNLVVFAASASSLGAALDGDYASAGASALATAAALTAVAFVSTANAATGEALRLALRGAILLRGLRGYLRGAAPFSTSALGAAGRLGRVLDTPDQRLTGDVENLSRDLARLLWGGYDGGGGALETLTTVVLSVTALGSTGNGSSVALAVSFALVSAVVTTVLANGSNRATFRSDEAMGHVRTTVAGIAAAGVEISAWGGQPFERARVREEVRRLSAAKVALALWDGAASTWSGIAAGLPLLLGYVAVAASARSLQRAVSDTGENTSALDATAAGILAGVTTSLARALCTLPALWGVLAGVGGSLARVTQLWAAVEWRERGAELGEPDSGESVLRSNSRAFDASLAHALAGAWEVRRATAALEKSAGSQSWHLAVVGPSGAGKSTVVRLLAGLLPGDSARPSSGDDDEDSADGAARWRAPLTAYCPQRPCVPPSTLAQAVTQSAWAGRTQADGVAVSPAKWLVESAGAAMGVDDDICTALLDALDVHDPFQSTEGVQVAGIVCNMRWSTPATAAALKDLARDGECGSGSVSDADILALLASVRLGHLATRFGLHRAVDWRNAVSGGELSRLAIAAALCAKSRAVVLDEPFAALDVESEAACRDAIARAGCGVVLVGHSADEACVPQQRPSSVVMIERRTRNVSGDEGVDSCFVTPLKSSSALGFTAGGADNRITPNGVENETAGSPPTLGTGKDAAATTGRFPPVLETSFDDVDIGVSTSSPQSLTSTPVSFADAFRAARNLFWTYGFAFARPSTCDLRAVKACRARGVGGFGALNGAPLSPLAAAALFIIASVCSVCSTFISVAIPRVVGDAFDAVISGDAGRASSALTIAIFWFVLSPMLSAATRTAGTIISLQWFVTMLDAGVASWLTSPAPARITRPASMSGAANADVWLRWTPPHAPPLTAALPGLDRLDQRLVGDTWTLSLDGGQIVWGGGSTLPLIQVFSTVILAGTRAASFGPTPALAALVFATLGAFATRIAAARVPRAAAATDCAEGLLRAPLLRVAGAPEESTLAGVIPGEAARTAGALSAVLSSGIALVRAQLPSRLTANVVLALSSAGGAAVTAAMLSGGVVAHTDTPRVVELAGLLSVLALYAGYLPTLLVRAAAVGGPASRVDAALSALRENALRAGGCEDAGGDAGARIDVARRDASELGKVLEVSVQLPGRLGGSMIRVHAGERTPVVAPSGTGKSTFVRSLGGLAPAHGGALWIRVNRTTAWAVGGGTAMLGPRGGLVVISPQRPYWPPNASAVQAVAYPSVLLDGDDERARDALRRCGLAALANSTLQLDVLSGGERARLMLARILFSAPRIAVLDEPVAALDGGAGKELLDALKEGGVSVVDMCTR